MAEAGESPFKPEHFAREDEGDDRGFYLAPRLVTHIDEPACAALARYYGRLLPAGGEILDMMSSFVSLLPTDIAYGRVVGHGMNQAELDANPQLTDSFVHDLNANPTLPLPDRSFDGCIVTVSVQYLTQPLAVFRDVARVLRPGAPLAVTFSNRMFPTKAVAIWRGLGDADHGRLVDLYFQHAGGFDPPQFEDISPSPGQSDPLYSVVATRSAEAVWAE
jgi:SAM-dependent methyltransferase